MPFFSISECIHVTSEEGRFFYKALQDSDQVCGVYFLTDPDKIVEVHFEYFDVPCQEGGLVSVTYFFFKFIFSSIRPSMDGVI